jgi:hypothetical protein
VLPGLPYRPLLPKTIGTTGSKDEMYLVSKYSKYITKRQKNRTENGQGINHADQQKKTEWANGNDMDPPTNST